MSPYVEGSYSKAPGPAPTSAPASKAVGSHRFLKIWALAWLSFFLAGALWAGATPLFAAPDEPAQVIHAAAIVRGQLIGAPVKGLKGPYSAVSVPKAYASAPTIPVCFAFHSNQPAGCAPKPPSSNAPTQGITYVGRYPPLYYLIVGLASLPVSSGLGVYLMRLASDLLSSIFLALAVASVTYRRTSFLLLGALLVAATPMEIFLLGVVNPDGLEIAAAISTWTAGILVVSSDALAVDRVLVNVLGASAVVLTLTSGLSPLWTALIGLTLLGLATPLRRKRLLASFAVRRWLSAILLVAVIAMAWIFSQGSLRVVPNGVSVSKGAPGSELWALALGHVPELAKEMVGVFGWLDTPSAFVVIAMWAAALGALVLLAAAGGTPRQRRVLLGISLAAVAVPTALAASHARTDGILLQGRDILPFAVGIPLVAASSIPEGMLARPLRIRIAVVLTATVALGQLLDFVWALRRYTVGLDGPLDFASKVRGGWAPPVPAVVLVAGYALVWALVLLWARARLRQPQALDRSLSGRLAPARGAGQHVL